MRTSGAKLMPQAKSKQSRRTATVWPNDQMLPTSMAPISGQPRVATSSVKTKTHVSTSWWTKAPTQIGREPISHSAKTRMKLIKRGCIDRGIQASICSPVSMPLTTKVTGPKSSTYAPAAIPLCSRVWTCRTTLVAAPTATASTSSKETGCRQLSTRSPLVQGSSNATERCAGARLASSV